MKILHAIGETLVVIGIIGGSFLPDILAGRTMAERKKLEWHADSGEKARKSLRYTLIFIGVAVVGVLLLLLSGGDIVKWFNGDR